MAIIEKKIRFAGSRGSQEVVVLFDSGSSYSCMRPVRLQVEDGLR